MSSINNDMNVGSIGSAGSSVGRVARSAAGGEGDFARILQQSIGEVSRLQQDATRAVEDLVSGRTEDMAGVMTAVEKADVAFKTLLAIRAKLMDAYDEIKNMPI